MKTNKNSPILTASQLRTAANLADEIEAKQNQLTAILSGGSITFKSTKNVTVVGGKRQFSAEVKAKIAAGQAARWARVRAEKAKQAGNTAPAPAPATAS